MTWRIASVSWGKDSLAMLHLMIEDDCRLHPYVDITVRCRCGEMVRHRFAFADYAMRDMAGKALFQERALEKWNERALAVPSLARIMRMLKEHTVE